MKNSNKTYCQGYYKPNNPDKYIGNVNKIRFLSSWEREFNKFLDGNPNVLRWASEGIRIPYINPVKGSKICKYLPDYFIEYKDKEGNIHREIIEIKPAKEAQQAMFLIEHNFKSLPPIRSKNPTTVKYQQLMMMINAAKWRAAILFCNKYNLKFKVLTEKQIFK